MRNVYRVQTPENVSLEFELAGVGSRGVAAAIDTIIQYTILAIIGLMLILITGEEYFNLMLAEGNTLYIVIALLLIFIMQFGYFTFFEIWMKGSTPGKKIVGLKVMMANGEPLTFTTSLIRNFIRIGDMLPGIYAVGIFSVIFNHRYMRVGDLAANTVVVKVSREKSKLTERPSAAAERHRLISQREEALLIEYQERKRNIKHPLNSINLEAQLYHYFYGKIGLVPELPNHFSRRVYLEKLMKYLGIS